MSDFSKRPRPQHRSDRASGPRKPKPHFAPKHARPRGRPFTREQRSDVSVLYGWHTVLAALTNPARRIRSIVATENALRRLQEEGVNLTVTPEVVRPDALAARLGPDALHQGLLVEADPLEGPALDELAPSSLVLILDQITDPHNVGAIMRSAAAFSVDAIVTTARHSPEATGVLAKSASGALEYVPLVLVQNLARAMAELRERHFQLIGLDSDGTESLADVKVAAPCALVLGAEGKGLRQLTRATCDVVARLDMPGAIKSLNVSNAAAVSLYIVRQHLS